MSIEDLKEEFVLLISNFADNLIMHGDELKDALGLYLNELIPFEEFIDRVNTTVSKLNIAQQRVADEFRKLIGETPRDVNMGSPNIKVNDVVKYLFDDERETFINLVNRAMIRKARWL